MSGDAQLLDPKTGHEAVLILTENHLWMLALTCLDHFTLESGQTVFAVIVSNAGVHPFRHLLPG